MLPDQCTTTMKVLVTGASGFLGGRLCHFLLSHGHSVRAFVRPTSDVSALPSPSDDVALEFAYGDVTNYPSLLAACSGCHAVYHAAAIVESWLPDPSKFFDVNVGGLKNLLRVVKETGTIKKIVYTSSFFALGSTDGYIADESQMHSAKSFCTEYEKAKTIADNIALEAARQGVPIVIVCPGVMYGPGKISAGNILARTLIERFNGRLPGYIGNGNDRFSFSHVDDVANGHIQAMEKGQPGQRYLLTGENASFTQVFDIAADITNTKRSWINIPLFVIELYGWLSVLFCIITGKLPLISPPVVYCLRHQWAYSCDKARRELNYKPRNLTQGLQDILPWLKKSGFIKY
ncbi:hypothetical protein M8C21_024832 [Ambrosia artemisiifolia]|uniref:NAD-dependent epimerase/dehydratase domain-containing protein n=1 Tax=Ambrosia artemisiifolia TaxID=4212 RepID=A0AAD5C475_AMBAR|nr:hypothetical protein M8C21_024832 [Ambrosia artemisiifolia]